MKAATILSAAIMFMVSGTLPAHAYLDPGTGTLIVQSIIGGVAAAITIAGIYIARIRNWFGRVIGKKQSDSSENSET